MNRTARVSTWHSPLFVQIFIPRATKSVLHIACVDKVSSTSALEYFMKSKYVWHFSSFCLAGQWRLYVKEIYLAQGHKWPHVRDPLTFHSAWILNTVRALKTVNLSEKLANITWQSVQHQRYKQIHKTLKTIAFLFMQ